jgi:Uma2 family endonuclease
VATVTPTQAFSSWPLPSPDEVYRLTTEQFDRMVRDGTLDEDEPVELLNGVLVTRIPKNPSHRVATRKTVRALERVLPAGWIAQKEEALVMPPGNKWESDVAVVRSELEFDSARDATAADCCMVVEIAETNLWRARTEKLPAYAAGGIPVYWIVNLSGGATPGSALSRFTPTRTRRRASTARGLTYSRATTFRLSSTGRKSGGSLLRI